MKIDGTFLTSPNVVTQIGVKNSIFPLKLNDFETQEKKNIQIKNTLNTKCSYIFVNVNFLGAILDGKGFGINRVPTY